MDLLSGAPFWPIKNGLLATYPPLDRDITCDVAIIGGGITGAAVAHELACAGCSVIVLDRRDIGTGSTSGSTSLLQYEIDVPLTDLATHLGETRAVRAYRLCEETLGRIAQLASPDCDFQARESIYGASRLADVAPLHAEYELRKRHGFRVRYWNRERIARESTLPFHAAIVSRPSGQMDAHCFAHELLRRALRHGAHVFDRTTVSKWSPQGRGVALRTDRGPVVRARRVVVAAGYEADAMLREHVTTLHTTFAVISEPLAAFPGWPARRLVWETARPYFYARTTADGRVLFGGEDEPFVNPRRRARALPHKARKLLRHFRRYFPEVAVEPAYTWAGTFAETKDGLPYIGPHAGFPRTYFALGYGGNGITFSFVAAGIIRDLCLGKANADAELFRFGR